MPLTSPRILLLLAAIAIAAPRGASGESLGSARRCRLEIGKSVVGLANQGLITINRCYDHGNTDCGNLDRPRRTPFSLSRERSRGVTAYWCGNQPSITHNYPSELGAFPDILL